MLLSAGVPLIQALSITGRLSPGQELDQVIQKVSEGQSLARALADRFPPVVISSLQGAEQAGNLEEVLLRLSLHYEAQSELEEKIKSALVYPAFVVMLCLLSLIFLLVFVLPSFRSLLQDFNAELPLFTRLIIGAGELVNRIWYFPFFGCAGLALVLPRYRKTPQGAQLIDRLILKISIFRKSLISQTVRTLGELLLGGVPIIEALRATVDSVNNSRLKLMIAEIQRSIENGTKLSQAMTSFPVFAREMIDMTEVGENSGQLAEMLVNAADLYDREREHSIKRFTTLLEPMMTLVVGLLVGVIAVAMFLPLVNMISQLQ